MLKLNDAELMLAMVLKNVEYGVKKVEDMFIRMVVWSGQKFTDGVKIRNGSKRYRKAQT